MAISKKEFMARLGLKETHLKGQKSVFDEDNNYIGSVCKTCDRVITNECTRSYGMSKPEYRRRPKPMG